jgi:uncharacterized protein (TIGR02145 family)
MWMENGVAVSGATGESYTNTAGKATAGTYVYTRLAKMPNCNWQASNSFIVWVMGGGSAPVITASTNTCSGTDLVFSVPASPGAKYEWSGNGVAKDNTYTYAAATAGEKTAKVRVLAEVNGQNCNSGYSEAKATIYPRPTISTQPASTQVCINNAAQLSVTATNVLVYQWFKDGTAVTEGSGATTAAYTTAELTTGSAKYKVVLSNGSCSVTSNEVAVTITEDGCCDKPGKTLLFTTFNPCANAPTGSTWTLTDDRESDNVQNYKVKKMADGRIWMVQNLKFGKGCDKTKFTGSNANNQKDKVAAGYYGDCRMSTQANGGYFYDWAAAINKIHAYTGAVTNPGCTGTGPAASDCQGICPNGWHVPTQNEFDDADAKFKTAYGCSNNCWNSSSAWESVHGGFINANGSLTEQGSTAIYWSSTLKDRTYVYAYKTSAVLQKLQIQKHAGLAVRCIKDE